MVEAENQMLGIEKKMSLLEENIKTKGENAYYYAHKRIFDPKEPVDGKILEGPGIITGGDPVLLDKSLKTVEVIKENKKFTKYIFYDDDKFVRVKIELPENIKDKVTLDGIEVNYQEKSFDLRANIEDSDPYFFSIKKLFKKVIPEECITKLVKGKIVLSLKKKSEDEEWDKLNA